MPRVFENSGQLKSSSYKHTRNNINHHQKRENNKTLHFLFLLFSQPLQGTFLMFVDPHKKVRNIKSSYNHMSNARAWDKENSLKSLFTKYNAVRENIHQLQCHYQLVVSYTQMFTRSEVQLKGKTCFSRGDTTLGTALFTELPASSPCC